MPQTVAQRSHFNDMKNCLRRGPDFLMLICQHKSNAIQAIQYFKFMQTCVMKSECK